MKTKLKTIQKVNRLYDACQQVVKAKSFGMISQVDGQLYFWFDSEIELPLENESQQMYLKDCSENVQQTPGTVLDMFTANAYVQVYDALSAESRAKMDTFDIYKQVNVALKLALKYV